MPNDGGCKMTVEERYQEGIAQGWQPEWVLWCIHMKSKDFEYKGFTEEEKFVNWLCEKHLEFEPSKDKRKESDYPNRFFAWLKEWVSGKFSVTNANILKEGR